MIELNIPIAEERILSLHAGDAVAISGIATTGRDAAHKYLVEHLIEGPRPLPSEDQRLFEELKTIYRGGAIYHSGPIVRNVDGRWSIVSAGPTTSIRDEIYEDKVIAAFGLRVVIGKGGMGPRTLAACRAHESAKAQESCRRGPSESWARGSVPVDSRRSPISSLKAVAATSTSHLKRAYFQ